jgi:hypothetical protein
MEDGRLSSADRQRWAAERRAVEQHLPDAYRWRRAAIGLGEDLLAVLKSRLFDPTQPAPDVGELQHLEALIARLRRIDDALLVHEYRDWQRLQPGMVAAMVASMRRRERAERTALETYLGQAEAVA